MPLNRNSGFGLLVCMCNFLCTLTSDNCKLAKNNLQVTEVNIIESELDLAGTNSLFKKKNSEAWGCVKLMRLTN